MDSIWSIFHDWTADGDSIFSDLILPDHTEFDFPFRRASNRALLRS